ncbi:MAG: hypothetical protein IPQ25_12395 [Chitinophagaceae bacterium]|nr:hypothetical protein [Chitinophagaceae bacterium]
MKKYIFCCLMLFSVFSLLAQSVGVNTSSPDPSAALDISSTNSGLLVPRMNTGQRTTIASPANGLMVFDTDTKSYWFRESTNWVELASSIGLKSVNGNATFTPYNINPKRYMWELNGSHPTGTSIALPQAIIEDLCADEDGCKVTLTMTNWGQVLLKAPPSAVLSSIQLRVGPEDGGPAMTFLVSMVIMLSTIFFQYFLTSISLMPLMLLMWVRIQR